MILIFWRRWGALGLLFFVLAFLSWVAIAAGLRAAMHDTATNGWWNVVGLVVGFGIGAAANYVFAVRVAEPKLDRLGTDSPLPRSTLFFLPLRHWTWAIVGLGLVFLVPNILSVLAS